MRKFAVSVCLLFLSSTSWAFEKGQADLQAGLGWGGSRGILGVSLDQFMTEHHVLSGALGLDIVGATISAGYKYFDKAFNKPGTGTFLDKCFFLVDCDSYPYLGLSLQHSGGVTSKITKDGVQSTYKEDPAWLWLAALGFRDVFRNNLTFDLEISYRSKFSGGTIHHVDGPFDEGDSRDLSKPYVGALGVGVALGYLF